MNAHIRHERELMIKLKTKTLCIKKILLRISHFKQVRFEHAFKAIKRWQVA